MALLGRTNLDVFPICLGGNVFGWTADEPTSFRLLDAFVAAGFTVDGPRLSWDGHPGPRWR